MRISDWSFIRVLFRSGQGPAGRGLHHPQRGWPGQRDRRKHLLRADVMNDEHDDRDTTDDKHRHPLREPMIWLVIALPLAAVLGGIWLMVLSSRSGSIDSVSDNVQRTDRKSNRLNSSNS